jgi:hypothetical protein|tara:strand:- start:453 stop:668 length:216 start_codon:yes stop_codon:yes gene_type:complete
MNPIEFYLWLNGYLEALESEGIEVCKIKNIREKISEVKNRSNQERVVFGPNVNKQQQSYVHQTPTTREGIQ